MLRWGVPTDGIVADARDAAAVLELWSTDSATPLDTFVAPPERLLISSPAGPMLWAAGSASRWGLHVRRGVAPTVAPPWTADRCRRIRAAHPDHDGWWTAWAFAFAEALAVNAHPIAGGRWELRRAEVTTEWAARRRLDGLSVDTVELDDDLLTDAAACFLTWDIGSAWLLPLRTVGPADDGRVKSAAKLAADGMLPPLLLWWHSGLHAHLLLDGHVRLAACRASGAPIRALTLTRADVVAATPEVEEARATRVAVIEAHVVDAVRRNQLLADLHQPLGLRRSTTRARILSGGLDAWRRGADPAWGATVDGWLAN